MNRTNLFRNRVDITETAWDKVFRNPVWLKFECDNGNRWTIIKGSICDDGLEDGAECFHSKCQPGHKMHLRGETKSIDEAAEWSQS